MSRLLKMGISLAFFVVWYAWNSIRRIMGLKAPGFCVVLYYHNITSQQRARFARQMDDLLRCSRPIAPDLRHPLAPGERFAAVTFDDGFEGVLDNALPELEKRGIPSALFVVTEMLGAHPQWESFGAEHPRQEKTLSAPQLCALSFRNVTIGSHTMTHPYLPGMSTALAKQQLNNSRTTLERLLGRDVRLFSFPYGAFDHDLVDLCREAGYKKVFTILPTVAFARPDEFVVGRVAVEPSDWQLEFRLKLLGAYRWLPLAFVLKRTVLSGRIWRKTMSVGPRTAV
jgi:peptidoglycan/xylan/chitin deacetylase (PgdA/CDA1 family)